jgi:hypothetical protein
MMDAEVKNFNHFSTYVDESNRDEHFPRHGILLDGPPFTLSMEENAVVGKWGDDRTRSAGKRVTKPLVSWGWYRNDGPMTWLLFNSANGKKYRVGFMKVKDPDNLKQVLIQLGRLERAG